MKINLEINNLTKSPIENIAWRKITEKVLEKVGGSLRDKKISLSVAWVNENEIQALNKKYRKKNVVTDVLSFSEFDNLNNIKKAESTNIFLGELILCYDDIKRYTEQERISLSKEVIKVFIHGLLHLLGFSHGEKMFQFQKEIISHFLNEK
jgi:probable rRNA maturation factor